MSWRYFVQAGEPADAQDQVFRVLLPMVKSSLVDSNPQVFKEENSTTKTKKKATTET